MGRRNCQWTRCTSRSRSAVIAVRHREDDRGDQVELDPAAQAIDELRPLHDLHSLVDQVSGVLSNHLDLETVLPSALHQLGERYLCASDLFINFTLLEVEDMSMMGAKNCSGISNFLKLQLIQCHYIWNAIIIVNFRGIGDMQRINLNFHFVMIF